jgi:hypothetical protein
LVNFVVSQVDLAVLDHAQTIDAQTSRVDEIGGEKSHVPLRHEVVEQWIIGGWSRSILRERLSTKLDESRFAGGDRSPYVTSIIDSPKNSHSSAPKEILG